MSAAGLPGYGAGRRGLPSSATGAPRMGEPASDAPGRDDRGRQPSALARKSKSQPSGACVTLRR